MSIEALAMAGVDYLDCDIKFDSSLDQIPSYLLANGGTEDEQYHNFCIELDMAIRGFHKDHNKEIKAKSVANSQRQQKLLCPPFTVPF
ncbi:hypothetical protein ACOSQ4_010277 [Xanthoceras sorbifolium]